MTLTQARLKELLVYSPKTGEFTRRVERRGRAAGEVVGSPHMYYKVWRRTENSRGTHEIR